MKLRAILCVLLAAGCAGPERFGDRAALSQGLAPSLSDHGAADVSGAIRAAQREADNETNLLKAYAIRGGVPLGESGALPANGSKDWYFIADAGMNDLTQKCEAYVDAIFQLRRDLGTAKDQLALAGATTATLLGVFGAAAEAVAATAAGFGFATQGIANASENILFTVDPSGVRKLIGRSQSTFRAQIERDRTTYENRPTVVRALQGYLSLCLPSTVEMQINESVSLTDFGIRTGGDGVSVFDIERVPNTETQPARQSGTVGGVTPRGVGARAADGDDGPDVTAPSGCRTPDECGTPESQLRALQAALCIPETDRANAFGPKTRSALASIRGWVPDSGPGALVSREGGDTFDPREIRNLVGAGACPAATFRNALERFRLGNSAANYSMLDGAKVDQLAGQLTRRAAPPAAPPQGAMTQALRDAIKVFQKNRMIEETGALDPDTLRELSEGS